MESELSNHKIKAGYLIMQIRKFQIISIFFILLCIAFNSYAVPGQDTAIEMIPDVFIPFDTGNTPEYVFVVEKESQHFFVFEFNGTPKKIFQTSCSTGKNIGDKKLSGDKKTPEGIYFFTKIYDDAQLAPIYGIRAFPTDYPNLMDRIAGKTGSAIWLHGTNKNLKPRDSSGCVALRNSDLEKISKYITLNRTPIIITDKLGYEPFESKTDLKQCLIQLVSGWKTALAQGTYHEYLSYYDSEYVPDISWWTEWNKTRAKLQLSKKNLGVESKRTVFFKYKDMVVMLFDLYIRYDDRLVMTGTKKFFLSNKQDQLKIIGENYQTFPKFNEKIEKIKENPFILASRNLIVPEQTGFVDADDTDIETLIDNWLKAWSSKDIKAYGSFYADNFHTQGMNKKSWIRYKDKLNKKYKYIRVSKRNLKIIKDNKRIRVSFYQDYESNLFKASGLKQIELKLERGQWKIYRENWKKI